MISIDMPAGPSEVLVIADKHASPVHIAADLLSQVPSPLCHLTPLEMHSYLCVVIISIALVLE